MQFRDHPAVSGKRDLYPIDPRQLKVLANYNVRDLSSPESRAHIENLKESIRPNGVQVPLEVRLRDDDIFIVAGHCRHAAVMELIAEGVEILTVPCLPEPKNSNDIERTIRLVTSNSGAPLKPIEVAEVVRRLVAYGWERGKIAERLGWKSTASVNQHLELLSMPAEVQGMVRNNEVSATVALREVKRNGAEAATQTLKEAKQSAADDGKTKVTPKRVRETSRPPKPQQLSMMPRPAAAGKQELIDTLGIFARHAALHDLNERGDDEVVEIPVRDLKQAYRVHRKVTGGEEL